jgi:hypothetical protein
MPAAGGAGEILRLPHFIGIGAPRCGTTWTFKMLRLHPQVWLPWKEMHFFDSIDPDTDSGYDIRSHRFRFERGWQYALRRLALRSVPGGEALMRRHSPLRAIRAPGYRWTTRYFLGDVSLRWYESLFAEGAAAGLRCGEITPAYFMLSEPAIANIARALPDLRAFLLLRNPIQWAWSGLCKDVRAEGRDPLTLTEAEAIARCPVPRGRSRVDLGSNLRRWRANFPQERLLVCFHDDLRRDPAGFLDRLCAHIGAGPYPDHLRGLLTSRVNSSARGIAVPPAISRYLAERFRAETALVAELAGGPAHAWLAEMEAILAR